MVLSKFWLIILFVILCKVSPNLGTEKELASLEKNIIAVLGNEQDAHKRIPQITRVLESCLNLDSDHDRNCYNSALSFATKTKEPEQRAVILKATFKTISDPRNHLFKGNMKELTLQIGTELLVHDTPFLNAEDFHDILSKMDPQGLEKLVKDSTLPDVVYPYLFQVLKSNIGSMTSVETVAIEAIFAALRDQKKGYLNTVVLDPSLSQTSPRIARRLSKRDLNNLALGNAYRNFLLTAYKEKFYGIEKIKNIGIKPDQWFKFAEDSSLRPEDKFEIFKIIIQDLSYDAKKIKPYEKEALSLYEECLNIKSQENQVISFGFYLPGTAIFDRALQAFMRKVGYSMAYLININVLNDLAQNPTFSLALEKIFTEEYMKKDRDSFEIMLFQFLGNSYVERHWDVVEKGIITYVQNFGVSKELLNAILSAPIFYKRIEFIRNHLHLNPSTKSISFNISGKNTENIESLFDDKTFLNILGYMMLLKTYSPEFSYFLNIGNAAAQVQTQEYYLTSHPAWKFFPAFEKLNQKRQEAVNFKEVPYEFQGKHYTINPGVYFSFIEDEPVESVSFSQFKKMMKELTSALETKKYDAKQTVCIPSSAGQHPTLSETYTSVRPIASEVGSLISKRVSADVFKPYFESGTDTGKKMQTVLTYAVTLSDRSKAEDELSPRHVFLLNFMQNMLSCSGGNLEAIDTAYQIAVRHKTSISNSPLQKVHGLLKLYHLYQLSVPSAPIKKLFVNANSSYLSHLCSYTRSLIGQEIGIIARGSMPEFDRSLYDKVVLRDVSDLTKQQALDAFLETYDLKAAIYSIWTHGSSFFQKNTIPDEKALVLFMEQNNFIKEYTRSK